MRKAEINNRTTPFSHWLRVAEVGDIYLLPPGAQWSNVQVSAKNAGVSVDLAQCVVVEGTRTNPTATPGQLVRVTEVL